MELAILHPTNSSNITNITNECSMQNDDTDNLHNHLIDKGYHCGCMDSGVNSVTYKFGGHRGSAIFIIVLNDTFSDNTFVFVMVAYNYTNHSIKYLSGNYRPEIIHTYITSGIHEITLSGLGEYYSMDVISHYLL